MTGNITLPTIPFPVPDAPKRQVSASKVPLFPRGKSAGDHPRIGNIADRREVDLIMTDANSRRFEPAISGGAS